MKNMKPTRNLQVFKPSKKKNAYEKSAFTIPTEKQRNRMDVVVAGVIL